MAAILVIDDSELLRKYLREALSALHHEVFEAENGSVGLAVLEQRPVDLVLCDLFMPEKEGLETIREIQQRFKEIPVIAMSGGAPNLTDFLPLAKRLGAIATLQKPIDTPQLQNLIATILSPQTCANASASPGEDGLV